MRQEWRAEDCMQSFDTYVHGGDGHLCVGSEFNAWLRDYWKSLI